MTYPSLRVSVTGMSILDLVSVQVHVGCYRTLCLSGQKFWYVRISEELGLILGLETRDSDRSLAHPLSNALK